MTTALSIVQSASGEMGLAVPTIVANSTSTDVVQLKYLLNAVGQEMVREFPWQILQGKYTFTTSYTTITGNLTQGSSTVSGIASTVGLDTTYMVSGIGLNQGTFITAVPSGTTLTLSQPATASGTGVTITCGKVSYSLPSDYDRQIDRTHWDKTKHWELLGPETPQQYQWLISGYISTGPRIRYRLQGNLFSIWPMVTTNDVLGLEYISKNWLTDANGVGKSSFTSDTDIVLLPDRLLISGLKLKYFEVKGFDTTAFREDFDRELNIAKANDAGSQTLSMSPKVSNILINWTQIPDSGYGT